MRIYKGKARKNQNKAEPLLERLRKVNYILKDGIFAKYDLPIIRLNTTGNGEKEKIVSKLNELLNKKEAEEEKKASKVVWVFAIIGIIAAVAAAVYGIYRFFAPDYLEDFEDDFEDDFDDDFFEDEEDDDKAEEPAEDKTEE